MKLNAKRTDSQLRNDLFFTCSLLHYMGRHTKNSVATVIDALGKSTVEKIYSLADVYHCENIASVCDRFADAHHISTGSYDSVAKAKYSVPSCWDLGKIFARLISRVALKKGLPVIDSLFLVYHSSIYGQIENYNSSLYYDTPQNHLQLFLESEVSH